jgi:D-aspartate ligase
MTIPAAIVLCVGPTGLGAVRGLAKAGIPVAAALTWAKDDPVLWSRFPESKVVCVADSASDILEAVRRLAGPRHQTLIPTSDRFASLLQEHRAELEKSFSLSLPPGDLAPILIDKARETELIESLGIPLPRTVRGLPTDPSALVAALGLPIIVKPRSFREIGILRAKNRILRSADDVARFYDNDTYVQAASSFLAQEVIPGPDDCLWVCNCCFGPQGDLLGAFTFRRFRTSPAHYGVTSYAMSEAQDEVVAYVRKLGAQLGYQGPAMVEFKVDPRDGRPKYLELNPRLGMCTFFDTSCGVNNAAMAHWVALGRPVPDGLSGPQREGVVFLSLWADVYARLKDGESILAIARHYASNLLRPHVGLYFSWSDPLPALAVAGQHAGEVLRSLRRRLHLS